MTLRVSLAVLFGAAALTACAAGPDGLDGFGTAMLDKDWQGEIHSNPALPQNWARMA